MATEKFQEQFLVKVSEEFDLDLAAASKKIDQCLQSISARLGI